MHISKRETPAVRALTSSKNRKFGFVSVRITGCAVKRHLLQELAYFVYYMYFFGELTTGIAEISQYVGFPSICLLRCSDRVKMTNL
jgi:hypothetical protein